ncbi:glutamate dehydrogenase [Neisseria meningitidis]|nr:glutamate dehydrogenase [Neisseria meningitidis]
MTDLNTLFANLKQRNPNQEPFHQAVSFGLPAGGIPSFLPRQQIIWRHLSFCLPLPESRRQLCSKYL